jgi:hypothetical protein
MAEVFGPLIFFTAITLWIVLPIYYRNQLYRRTIEVVGKAIEHGIDPERIQFKLPQLKQDEGDVNGNWKAGIILAVLGLVFTFAVSVPMYYSGNIGDDGRFAIFLPGSICVALGITLLVVHKTIVGAVVRRTPKTARDLEQG